jgi:hypothetical protein
VTRRSALIALLLAPFAWLLRRWRRKPEGYLYQLDTPMLFERGVPIGLVTGSPDADRSEYVRGMRQYAVLTYHPRLPRWDHEPVNEAPFSRLLAGQAQPPTWRFSDKEIDWKVLPIRGRS